MSDFTFKCIGSVFSVLIFAGCSHTPVEKPVAAPPTQSASPVADDHKADEKQLAKLFPGAKLIEKPMPFDSKKLKQLGARSGTKFTGSETEWEIFEATKKGKTLGWVMLCHADLAPNVEIHIGFSATPQLKILQTIGLERTNEGFKLLVEQFRGKDPNSAFQIGKDLHEVADYPPQFSQAVASTVHRGLLMLSESRRLGKK